MINNLVGNQIILATKFKLISKKILKQIKCKLNKRNVKKLLIKYFSNLVFYVGEKGNVFALSISPSHPAIYQQ